MKPQFKLEIEELEEEALFDIEGVLADSSVFLAEELCRTTGSDRQQLRAGVGAYGWKRGPVNRHYDADLARSG